jgi:hypothetical protein
MVQLLGTLIDEFDDLQALPDPAGGTAVEINTQILDEILRPLLAPQKVRLWPVKWVVFTSYTNKVYRG